MAWHLPRKADQIHRPLIAVSADPWTAGHEALVRETVNHFGGAVVAVMTDDQRRYTLPLTLRAALAKEGLVRAGLLPDRVDFIAPDQASISEALLQYQCDGVVRGARCQADLEVEERRRRCAADLLPGLWDRWVLWAPEDQDVQLLSASRVRDAIGNGAFLPPEVVGFRAQRALRYYLRGERVAVVHSNYSGQAEKLCQGIADFFSWGEQPVAVHTLRLSTLRSLDGDPGPKPSWAWDSDEEALLFRAQRAVGKARPSIRLFCMDSPGCVGYAVADRLGHGLYIGPAKDNPDKWLDPKKGLRAISLTYERTPRGDVLRNAYELLTTFEVP